MRLLKPSDAGLTVGATHTPWPRLLSELDDVIAEHQVLGCQHTAVGMIPPDTYLSLAGLNQFVEEARVIVDKLGASGMTFSYHHHHHEFQHFEGKSWLQHLFNVSEDFELGFEIDTLGSRGRRRSSSMDSPGWTSHALTPLEGFQVER